MKNILLQRNGRDQYGIDDDDKYAQREFERRQGLSPEQRVLDEIRQKLKLEQEKSEAENRIKNEQKEEKQKEENRQARRQESWANLGILDPPPELDPLFALGHKEYLQTPQWKKIRRRVLKRDTKICQTCGAKAVEVHHLSYDYEVIIGDRDEDLVSLCKSCHKKIELDESGNRRTDLKEKRVIFNQLKSFRSG